MGEAGAGREGSADRRRRVRHGLYLAIALLYVVSIPWYRESGAAPELVFGLPDWAALALACYALIAVLNAIAWLLTEVRDPPSRGGDAQ